MADAEGGPRWIEGVREELEARRVPSADQVLEALRRLARREAAAEALTAIRPTLTRLGDPLRALTTLEHCISSDPRHLEAAVATATVELSGASSWATRLLAAEPALTHRLVDDPSPPLDPEAATLAGSEPPERFDRQLRRLRNEALLEIALRELRGADIRETSRQIADLADTCTRAALAYHRPRLLAECGATEPPCDFVIIGMGKLGGGELVNG